MAASAEREDDGRTFDCVECDETFNHEDESAENFSDAFMLRGGGAICEGCRDECDYVSCDGCGYYAPLRKLESVLDKFYHRDCKPTLLKIKELKPMADEDEELTGEQIGRQDEVDGAIFKLAAELVPESYRQRLPVGGIAWNIEWISDLREKFQDVIFGALNIPEGERDAFDMTFYPYLAGGGDE